MGLSRKGQEKDDPPILLLQPDITFQLPEANTYNKQVIIFRKIKRNKIRIKIIAKEIIK